MSAGALLRKHGLEVLVGGVGADLGEQPCGNPRTLLCALLVEDVRRIMP